MNEIKEIVTVPTSVSEVSQEKPLVYDKIEDFLIDLEKAIADGKDLTVNLSNLFLLFSRELKALKEKM